jgi:hypothetical protein
MKRAETLLEAFNDFLENKGGLRVAARLFSIARRRLFCIFAILYAYLVIEYSRKVFNRAHFRRQAQKRMNA